MVVVGVLLLLNSPYIINDAGSRLMCENTLKTMARAFELYLADHEGVYPPTLVELGPYVKEKYRPGPGRAPSCPGSRGEDETPTSWAYVYRVPSNNEGVMPICWDSKAHRRIGIILPDMFRWNVLYSDGHVDRLSDREFLRELAKVAAGTPSILEGMELPHVSRRRSLPMFLAGVGTGMGVLTLILRRRMRGKPGTISCSTILA